LSATAYTGQRDRVVSNTLRWLPRCAIFRGTRCMRGVRRSCIRQPGDA
jgi:hypothetical protein